MTDEELTAYVDFPASPPKPKGVTNQATWNLMQQNGMTELPPGKTEREVYNELMKREFQERQRLGINPIRPLKET